MEAFSKVDECVSKPVMGSDGAARWQEFRKQTNTTTAAAKKASGAPLAPLKAVDRSSGISSWEEERCLENETRQKQGLESLENKRGYTHFKQKQTDEQRQLSAKERNRIVSKTRPDDQDYFFSASTFQGWKWDYIFTTRANYGTGYYWDGTDSLLELQGQRKRPTATTANHPSKRSKEEEEETDEAKQQVPPSPLQKKKKKLNNKQQVEIPTCGNHPLEQVAAALQQQQAALPPGWYSAKDPFTGKKYYYHADTGERSWDIPTLPLPPPSQWQSVVDPQTKKTYYYNTVTKETTWEKPPSLE